MSDVAHDPANVSEVVVVTVRFPMSRDHVLEPPVGIGTDAHVALPRRAEFAFVAGHPTQCARLARWRS